MIISHFYTKKQNIFETSKHIYNKNDKMLILSKEIGFELSGETTIEKICSMFIRVSIESPLGIITMDKKSIKNSAHLNRLLTKKSSMAKIIKLQLLLIIFYLKITYMF